MYVLKHNLIASGLRDCLRLQAVIQPDRSDYGSHFAGKFSQLFAEKRGAGYWAWKPYFLLRTLLELARDDDLVFCRHATNPHHNSKLPQLDSRDGSESFSCGCRW